MGGIHTRSNAQLGAELIDQRIFGPLRDKLRVRQLGTRGDGIDRKSIGGGQVFGPIQRVHSRIQGRFIRRHEARQHQQHPIGETRPQAGPISGLKCAKKYLGQSIPRNTCENNWFNDVDLSFSQELPGPGRLFGVEDKIKLFVTMDNFLNFLSSGSNIQRRRNFFGVQDIASTTGVDAQGRYIISSAAGSDTFQSDNGINFSSSVWRAKVGVSYNF